MTVKPSDLNAYLDAERAPLRAEVLALLGEPELQIPAGITLDEYRRRTLQAIRFLADKGIGRLSIPTEFGGQSDAMGAVVAFETLAYGDLSILVKFGVQFGLFGGSVLQLGTRRHHEEYLTRIGSLSLPGCYAMTETGHGSNVRDLETVARYDHAAGTLIVDTPVERAGKDWIGNAGQHGELATVFARLIVEGEDHGVHAILVPIRDDAGKTLPGVRIEDRGLKRGLNGVDNGRIWFDEVRVPASNLLDRFATIDADGRYQSPIDSSGKRFFTMLRTLVAGRVSIAAASVSGAKVALTIALRYTAGRRQFGARDAEEQPLLSYRAIQRSLAPRLATTFGLHFATRALQRRFADTGTQDDTEVEVLAAGLKAYASSHCVDTIQACREACGGQGYLAENRFAALANDTDIFTTFEGANLVLLQLVAKGLLGRYRDEMGDLNFWGAVHHLTDRAETRLTELNPLVTRRTDEDHLLDPDFHEAALLYREERLLRSVATRIRARIADGTDTFDAVNDVQDHIITLANAHVERVVLQAFQNGYADAPTPEISETLKTVCALYGLSRIEDDRGWFLETGYIEAGKSRAIRAMCIELSAAVSRDAADLVGGFGIPDDLLPPIAHAAGSA